MFDKDPLWYFLHHRLRLNTFFRSLLFSVGVGTVTFFVIPYFSNYLFPREGVLSSLSDWPGFVITFFTHPAIYVFYLYEQQQIFKRLQSELLRTQSEVTRQLFEDIIHTFTNSKLAPIVAVFLTAIGYFFHVKAVLAHPSFSYYYPGKFILYFINAPASSLAGYMVCLVAIRYLGMTISVIRLLKKHPPKINIYHPDKCGGLAFLGSFIFESFILVAIMAVDLGLLFVINLYQIGRNPLTEPSFMSFIFLYTVLLPIGFILPLLKFQNCISGRKGVLQKSVREELVKSDGYVFEIDKTLLESPQFSSQLNLTVLYKLLNFSTLPISRWTLIKFVGLFVFSTLPIAILFLNMN